MACAFRRASRGHSSFLGARIALDGAHETTRVVHMVLALYAIGAVAVSSHARPGAKLRANVERVPNRANSVSTFRQHHDKSIAVSFSIDMMSISILPRHHHPSSSPALLLLEEFHHTLCESRFGRAHAPACNAALPPQHHVLVEA